MKIFICYPILFYTHKHNILCFGRSHSVIFYTNYTICSYIYIYVIHIIFKLNIFLIIDHGETVMIIISLINIWFFILKIYLEFSQTIQQKSWNFLFLFNYYKICNRYINDYSESYVWIEYLSKQNLPEKYKFTWYKQCTLSEIAD